MLRNPVTPPQAVASRGAEDGVLADRCVEYPALAEIALEVTRSSEDALLPSVAAIVAAACDVARSVGRAVPA